VTFSTKGGLLLITVLALLLDHGTNALPIAPLTSQYPIIVWPNTLPVYSWLPVWPV